MYPFTLLTAGEETGEESFLIKSDKVNGTQPPLPLLALCSHDEVNLTQPDWRKAPDTFKVIVTVAFVGKLYSMSLIRQGLGPLATNILSLTT